MLSTRRSVPWRMAAGAVGLATLALQMPLLTAMVALVLGLSLAAQPRSQAVRIVARCVAGVAFEDIADCEVVGTLNREVHLRLRSGKRVRVFMGPRARAEYVAEAIRRALAGSDGPIAVTALPGARVVATRD